VKAGASAWWGICGGWVRERKGECRLSMTWHDRDTTLSMLHWFIRIRTLGRAVQKQY
jgi:hypothetical protein